jgi:catechol 2,3-dioxygenase-like lactoylglutathione lyase family enzyme
MGEMKYMGIGQVAINVDDLDAAVRDYTEIFGMQFTVVEVPEINVRAAVSDGGIVFAEPLDKTKEQPVSKYHNGALAAIEVRVSDLEEAKRRLEEKGIEPIYYMDTQGGLIEYYMKQFHGIPLTIFEMKTESWVEAIGGDDFDPSTYTYNIKWSDTE